MSIKRTVKQIVRRILPRPELSRIPVEKRARMLKRFYKNRMGADLNLDDPKTFTEKLQWIKLYYHHPDMQRCVDKFLFKNYVSEKIGSGYTAQIIEVWNTPEEVDLSSIKERRYVLKSTLQSDGIFIIPVLDANKIDVNTIENEIKTKWFNTRNLLTNSYCSAYYGAKPRVIVEQFIEEFSGASNDYKIFCFHGEPAFFYVAEDHFKNGENSLVYPITFYDLDWKPMDVRYGKHTTNPNVPEPKHKEEMIKLAKKLSEPFPFVRVDFFDTKEKVYVAELTFYPGGGITPYFPESFNQEMGEMIGQLR